MADDSTMTTINEIIEKVGAQLAVFEAAFQSTGLDMPTTQSVGGMRGFAGTGGKALLSVGGMRGFAGTRGKALFPLATSQTLACLRPLNKPTAICAPCVPHDHQSHTLNTVWRLVVLVVGSPPPSLHAAYSMGAREHSVCVHMCVRMCVCMCEQCVGRLGCFVLLPMDTANAAPAW